MRIFRGIHGQIKHVFSVTSALFRPVSKPRSDLSPPFCVLGQEYLPNNLPIGA
jgi:hypothetical protein